MSQSIFNSIASAFEERVQLICAAQRLAFSFEPTLNYETNLVPMNIHSFFIRTTSKYNGQAVTAA